MSKKRSLPESSIEDQLNNEGSGEVKQDDGAKRLKLAFLSDTSLLDLPLELIERIFVRAIVMEVEEMHLAKSAWKEKGDRVICRLKTVCPDWSNILTTNFFQNELYRTLGRTAETIHLEILRQSPNPTDYYEEVISLKDELFILSESEDLMEYVINVYDCNNVAVVKDVIDLSQMEAFGVVACSVSNCLYIHNDQRGDPILVYRITKEAEHKFSISPFISSKWKMDDLAVADNGNLILWKKAKSEQSAKVFIYDAAGSLQHKMKLSSDLCDFYKIIPRSNGNLVLVSITRPEDEDNLDDEGDHRTRLTEIDMNGTVLRRYRSSIAASGKVCLAGPHGRILIFEELLAFELLDSEFNLLNVIRPQLDMDKLVTANGFHFFTNLRYNSEKNELITILEDISAGFGHVSSVLFTFHFAEE